MLNRLRIVPSAAQQQSPTRFRATKGSKPRKLIRLTAHRRENFELPMESICYAVKELAGREEVESVYPACLNPIAQEPIHRILHGMAQITLLPLLEYLPMVHRMNQATWILTDSGGLREEPSSLGVPMLVS